MKFQDKNLKQVIELDASKYQGNKSLHDEIVSLQKDLEHYGNEGFSEEEILEVLNGNHQTILKKAEEYSTKKPKKATPAKKKGVDRAELVAKDVTSCRRVISIYREKQRKEELAERKAEAIAEAKNTSERRKLEKMPLDAFKEKKRKLTVPEKVEKEIKDLIEYVINQRGITFGTQAKLRKKALKKVKEEAVGKAVNGIKQLVLVEGREAYNEIISKIAD